MNDSNVEKIINNYKSRVIEKLPGYKFIEISSRTINKNINSTSAVFIMSQKELLFSIILLRERGNERDLFFLTLKDSTRAGQSTMYLNEILEKYNYPLKDFVQRKSDQDFLEFVDQFMSSCLMGMETYLKKYLDGKEWEETPFDWGDYK